MEKYDYLLFRINSFSFSNNAILILFLIILFMERITLNSGKLNDYLHHIDPRAYGSRRMLSVFVAQFEECSIMLDAGSSNDTKKILRYLKRNEIPLSSFKYLLTTHHHFDHNGGMWKLHSELKKHNPDVKILTNQKTKELLNDCENHLNRAKRTYGNTVGIMKPIEESAFEIMEPTDFKKDVNSIDIIDKFSFNGSEIKLAVLKTPGHTHDHQSPIFIIDREIEFIFLGEAAGTIQHSSELITMPTSMPTYFSHKDYMETLENMKKIFPLKAGYSHFGVVNGKENVRKILLDNETLMEEFRTNIMKYYQEKPETRYVVEKIMPMLTPRSDLSSEDHPMFQGIALGIVYGMLMDLGYRKD